MRWKIVRSIVLAGLAQSRGRTTYGVIGPVADLIYEIWNLKIFVL